MSRRQAFSRLFHFSPRLPPGRRIFPRRRVALPAMGVWLLTITAAFLPVATRAVILWNDPGTTLVHENGQGADILGGAVKRDDTANDTLYFKFHVNPLSDKDTEEYFAGLELFDGDTERLGIGNSLKAWAYSAFFHAEETGETNPPAAYIDLRTAKPEAAAETAASSYQYPRRGVGVTIVFKVQYIPGEDDLVTVWLNPDLGPGANEANQSDSLTSRFNANASFDEIRLRHGGRGAGWSFSDLAIATTFGDFVDASSARPNDPAASGIGGVHALNFRSWQKEQGLPPGPVRALAQTRDGYLWIGGDDCLTRFDGLRFVNYEIPAGIKCGQVTALLSDSQGALWIGSGQDGLLRWQNGQITVFTPQDGLPSARITALAEDGAGRVWVGTEGGLALCQAGKLSSLPGAEPLPGQPVTALFRDPRGVMWVGITGAGVFQYSGHALVPLPGESMEELLKDPHCLFVDQGGRIWVGAGDDFVLCRTGAHWQRYRIPRHQVKAHVTVLAGEADGTVWAGSSAGGLLAFKDGKSTAITASTGLAGNLIESCLTDQEGRLWVGTETGLNRLGRKELFALSQGEGLGFGPVQGLAEVTPGVVWAGKANDGLYRWDGKSFSRLPAAGLPPHDPQITALLVTHDGFCWVATTNHLLLYKDPIAAADEVTKIQPPQPDIVVLAEDRENTLWLGTRTGKILQLRANHWLELTNLAQTNAITAIVPAPDGSLWIGTAGSGLFQFENGGFRYVDRNEGLLSNTIRALHLDAQGSLWIGTESGSLSCWRHNHLENFVIHEAAPDNVISQILEDDFGRLWLGTAHGIACVSKTQLDMFSTGRIPAFYPKFFGRAEGMLSEKCTEGFFPSGLKTGSGLLWFPTLKGAVVIDPRAQPAVISPPSPVLEEVLVDDVPIPHVSVAQPLRITPGKHHVEFRYTGLGFDAPELIHFRYRLEGLDAGWFDAGTRRTAFYSFLPPGNYTFRIAARNNDGIWNETGAELELIVQRHFWQTGWFILSAGLGLMILVGGSVRLVVKRKLQRRLKHLEQERALERERTRIAQDLHDEMGAKLCRISFLSEHARRGELPPQELKEQIASISNASREVLHSLDEIVWAVNPQNDTLEHVASYLGQYAQDYFQMTGIQCVLDIPAEVPPHPLSSQTRHHLFLATHEALTNVLKHSGATQATMVMTLDQARFEINIADNGRGFEPPDLATKSETPPAMAGDGLANMRRRLAAIGGECQMRSRPGAGTRIVFLIPLTAFKKSNP